MGNSLKDLLHQEMDLDDLNKKVCQAKVKATKLKKQVRKQIYPFQSIITVTFS